MVSQLCLRESRTEVNIENGRLRLTQVPHALKCKSSSGTQSSKASLTSHVGFDAAHNTWVLGIRFAYRLGPFASPSSPDPVFTSVMLLADAVWTIAYARFLKFRVPFSQSPECCRDPPSKDIF
jgi:hypothetical protein